VIADLIERIYFVQNVVVIVIIAIAVVITIII